MKFLFLILALFFVACSEYPDMEPDILAQHIYSQNPIELGSSNKEYVAMLAKSFGMSEDAIIAGERTNSRMLPHPASFSSSGFL